jgi:uncharacterized FlgJ-related protein
MVGHCATAQSKLDNREKVRKLIRKYDIQHEDVVLRQAMYESGWLTCRYCSWGMYNNPFGFRHRDYITESNPKGYLFFENLEESVVYYCKWQLRYYHGGDYYVFLKNIGYAESKKYESELKRMW